jgi:hypothetical protein
MKALRGYDVFFAGNSHDAVYKLANNSFYAVIFDCGSNDQNIYLDVAMFMSLRDLIMPISRNPNAHDFAFYVPKVIINSKEGRETRSIEQILLRAVAHRDIWNSPDDLKRMLE